MLYFSRLKMVLIWLAVAITVILAVPNLFPASTLAQLPSWVPKRQMTLGLDLQGGSHILLQMDQNDLIKDQLETTRDEIRTLLRDAKIQYTGLGGTGRTVQVRINDPSQVEAAKTALKPITNPVAAGLFSGGSVQSMTLDDSEPGLLKFTVTDAGIKYRTSTALSQAIEVVERRVNALGTTEPIVQRQGDDRILVQVPGLQNPQRLKDIIGQTAKLTFQMVDTSVPVQDAMKNRPPPGDSVLYSQDDPPVPYLVENRVIVSGEDLSNATPTYNSQTNEPVVSFTFNSRGATRFGQATQQNVGKPFAIVLDNQVISAPVIREPILGGTGQISGNFTAESANDLAVLLRAGALPAKLTIIEERTVGPGLGQDSIHAGKVAGVIGSILVVAFMFVAYGFLGFIANVALAVHVAMIVGALSLLGATLTLPGIAGIVLTIGMAVDSNVLIYERIREERRNGRSVIQAIDTGFSKALATIVDSNVTSLIATVVLFFLGTGPVKGFAVTYAIGILTTVFTAFTFTRMLVAIWLRRARPKELPRAPVTFIPPGTKIPFMGIRRWTFALSSTLSILSVVGFLTLGINYGIDFRGGSLIEVQSKQGDANLGDIRSRLSDLNIGEIQVQQFGAPNDVLIRVGTQDAGENAEQTVIDKVRGELQDQYDFRRVEVVGPTVSGELAKQGTIAMLIALVGILLYVWFRFEWQFAVGAIVATVHDVVMTIGFFVLTGLEFNQSSLAAILTIIGYSLNDTIVVYDRVREDLRKYKKMPLPQLLNNAINETLSRTTLTSVTTSLALLALVLFGGEVIRSFTLAMLFGVVFGTYSSIFIAAPLLILFRLRPQVAAEEEKKPVNGKALTT
ncbi:MULTISPECIES: protein translocase subunit SecDF [unclassified Mesorhizobium]|uniref:protein translocase subunit SecDF n=1 Tax=unclassified Mesorhizobium TaxID=325217 RepID=UPI000F74E38B|nr:MULTISPECIES: protein translocase subunit SecDF [unclassified Mesorhizobium]AZO01982.1 protein translocase subunit SecDF [Mesorhizobium sp. M2A.F.Ca.ET.043.02.1.1]RUW38696.1 protein translocase subunit SecDF [Mesorhizobium sp. M2A.F.Ca.ET.015.02.1.1]RUW72254.1 protein translocase subunit SecDF [Mesorhizobium sp. M2A.F.Ca.ET.067.02.1.1]RVC92074.1 protein translocase subunit SecDF [Mesorhizobium sp. M2A.F.Ca.ET.017.03.2.1]RVD09503.1 protein translocase subunit SecDF [Mesorhizobium sp. M2A.F.C